MKMAVPPVQLTQRIAAMGGKKGGGGERQYVELFNEREDADCLLPSVHMDY